MKRFTAHLILLIAFLCAAINPLRGRARQALANANINRTVILGVKSISFARDGANDSEPTPDEPVTSTHKPVAASPAYESLGRVEKASVANKVDKLKIRNASTGVYGNEFTLPLGQELMLEFTMQNINQIIVEALYLTSGAITVATPLEPMAQTAKIKGWLQVLRYDQAANNTLTEFLWVELNITKGLSAEKSYTYDLSAKVLKNTLNRVEIPVLTAL